ncbi:MAG: PQQ-dependent sugar dehydrogenase [Dehalococcoidia bacterium]
MPRIAIATLVLALLLAACGGGDNESEPTATPPAGETPVIESTPTATESGVSIPQTEAAANITVPDGFTAYAIATGLNRASSLALADDGTIYVSERAGTVYRLVDNDGNGVFETLTTFADGYAEITGLFVAPDNTVYVSSRGRITTERDTDGDGEADEDNAIIVGLPNGRHQNNGLLFGPDGKLYFTNGSTCDDCVETDERSAAILQAEADGSNVRVYATGLRNPYDIAFDASGRLWSTDNGSDDPCATIDELDMIIDGGDYGWPYGEDGCDPLNDGIAPVASLGLHTASTGIDYYSADQFPAQYQGNLYMTVWGSFFAEPELPPQLLRGTISARSGGPSTDNPLEVVPEQFAIGFQHPIDVLVDHDGTLLVLDYGTNEADDGSAAVYRIVYTGP